MMKYFIFSSITLLVLHFNPMKADEKYVDANKLVNSINNDLHLPWKASTYGESKFDVQKFAKAKLGLIPEKHEKYEWNTESLILGATDKSNTDRLGLPVNFTWADPKVTNCPIGHIRDQSNCGSCWAVASVSSMGDRFCIQSNGKIKNTLSQEFVLGCSSANYGCDGGWFDRVNNFLVLNGTITGGDYESDNGCQTYSIRPCGWPREIKIQCEYNTAYTPKCRKRKCNNEWYDEEYEPTERTYKAKSWYYLKSNITHSREDRMREEIWKRGPIYTGFLVPRDFYFYKEGVYVPKRSWPVGAHAVRIVGWGIENGIKYWHVANSWSTVWGEKGFFKILRGVNLLFFEGWSSALIPKL